MFYVKKSYADKSQAGVTSSQSANKRISQKKIEDEVFLVNKSYLKAWAHPITVTRIFPHRFKVYFVVGNH